MSDEWPDDILTAAEAVVERGYDEGLIDAVCRALLAEREQCAAFAYAKHDWPARWIAASLRGENKAYAKFQASAIRRGTPQLMDAIDILKGPYTRKIVPDPVIPGSSIGFLAQIMEFPGCFATGDTAEEAAKNLEEVAEAWVQLAIERGRAVPEPDPAKNALRPVRAP